MKKRIKDLGYGDFFLNDVGDLLMMIEPPLAERIWNERIRESCSIMAVVIKGATSAKRGEPQELPKIKKIYPAEGSGAGMAYEDALCETVENPFRG